VNRTSQDKAVTSLYAAAKWFLDEGQLDKALEVFRVLIIAAANDERGWLGIGACHEALGQPVVALELYALGAKAAESVRCHVARARTLRALSRDDEATTALDAAEAMLETTNDEDLRLLVEAERRMSWAA
jgi:tetratricopeptide (TPR) repeat protein